ncbi:Hypothetical protein Minf_1708 [Methylacidiphilum infernorum V4]|uniref:Uncharacterized protein n=1 Tax=Methylacidiphilum infernorum (isolate V4) TaxID=481448 RepID=B3DWU9_METI4|nr:Hypothetical protein Minf_1708 [Methylacidiphilum infernorum V4]
MTKRGVDDNFLSIRRALGGELLTQKSHFLFFSFIITFPSFPFFNFIPLFAHLFEVKKFFLFL